MATRDQLVRALELLGGTLADRGQRFHIAIVGGSALLLANEIGRNTTRDVDVVSVARGGEPLTSTRNLPEELRDAAVDVADLLGLERDWLNAGAVGLLRHRLPEGYVERLRHRVYGELIVSILHRSDLLKLKVLAAFDEGPNSRHASDIRSMNPTRDELERAFAWAVSQTHRASRLIEDIAEAFGVEST